MKQVILTVMHRSNCYIEMIDDVTLHLLDFKSINLIIYLLFCPWAKIKTYEPATCFCFYL